MTFSNIGKLVAVTVLVVSTALVFAQGGGGGGGGRGGGGGGQGRGGFGQFGRGGLGGGLHNLASRADVQRDINATDDQKTKITALNQTMREEMMSAFGGFGGGGGGGGERPDMEAIRASMEKMNEKGKTELAKILDAGQMKRIEEIQIQLAGGNALLLPAVQKALGLSEEQKGKITALQTKQQEANMSIMEKQRNQEISREEAQAAREKNDKVLQEEYNKVLNGDQQTKLKELQGKPFKADPPQGRGGL